MLTRSPAFTLPSVNSFSMSAPSGDGCCEKPIVCRKVAGATSQASENRMNQQGGSLRLQARDAGIALGLSLSFTQRKPS